MATSNEPKKKLLQDYWWGILTIIILLAIIAMQVIEVRTGKKTSDTTLITALMLLLGFRYGSSKGSREKDNRPTDPQQ